VPISFARLPLLMPKDRVAEHRSSRADFQTRRLDLASRCRRWRRTPWRSSQEHVSRWGQNCLTHFAKTRWGAGRPYWNACRHEMLNTVECSASPACGRRAGGGSRMGRFWTGASTPDLQRGSSGRQRHQPSPPASWRRIQNAFEVPSSAVDRRVAVEVVRSHRRC
jgi:hypothetical protein